MRTIRANVRSERLPFFSRKASTHIRFRLRCVLRRPSIRFSALFLCLTWPPAYLPSDKDAQSVTHWVGEANGVQARAVLVFSPGLRQRLAITKVWKLAKRTANVSSAEHAVDIPVLSDECPMSLDQLLADDFSPREAETIFMDALKPGDAAQ